MGILDEILDRHNWEPSITYTWPVFDLIGTKGEQALLGVARRQIAVVDRSRAKQIDVKVIRRKR